MTSVPSVWSYRLCFEEIKRGRFLVVPDGHGNHQIIHIYRRVGCPVFRVYEGIFPSWIYEMRHEVMQVSKFHGDMTLS